MRTIKYIDLLAKIAKGETLPKKIKIYDKIWEYNDTNKDYYYSDIDVDDNISLLKYNLASVYSLNEEVEIIEDETIKHIRKTYDITRFANDYPEVAIMLKDITKKQYEIIDEINGGK